MADISNSSKPFQIYKKWTHLLFDEFFAQGDLEISQDFPVSYLCDRSTNIAKAQLGFIDFVVAPLYRKCEAWLPGLEQDTERL